MFKWYRVMVILGLLSIGIGLYLAIRLFPDYLWFHVMPPVKQVKNKGEKGSD